jgi:hypothetical protein
VITAAAVITVIRPNLGVCVGAVDCKGLRLLVIIKHNLPAHLVAMMPRY